MDITYIRLVRGWMYLVAIMDWYSRYVVSWELDTTLEVGLCSRRLGKGSARVSRRSSTATKASQFTSPAYIELVTDAGVMISMDSRGRALDNVFTERLWRSLKYEEVYLHEYINPRDAREGIGRYMVFYNQRRLHQSLGYRIPAEVYLG